jgi:hypothetical protein
MKQRGAFAMDLENIWNTFLTRLNQQSCIQSVTKHIFSGIPFLYIESIDNCHVNHIEHSIKEASAMAMKGKRLHSETIFVRNESSLYVYRHRFNVPQEKMFCCGNLCIDCIRLKK